MTFHIPLIVRGEVVFDRDLAFGGRHGGVDFVTADVSKYLDRLVLRDPAQMSDLHALTFDDILDYLQELGAHLDIRSNPYLQESYHLSQMTSGLGAESSAVTTSNCRNFTSVVWCVSTLRIASV